MTYRELWNSATCNITSDNGLKIKRPSIDDWSYFLQVRSDKTVFLPSSNSFSKTKVYIGYSKPDKVDYNVTSKQLDAPIDALIESGEIQIKGKTYNVIVKFEIKREDNSLNPLDAPKIYLEQTVTRVLSTYEVIEELLKVSCFPFDAIAITPFGKKRCEDLVLGEKILVDHKGTFEPILFFAHRDNCDSLNVELTLANDKKMSATPQHYIFIYNKRNKNMVFIKDVVKGDVVRYNGKLVKVAETNFIRKRGIIAPMTKSGEIVIDGVQASCYAIEKFLVQAKVAVNIVDALGITIPQFVVDPLRDTILQIFPM